jgi:hypothetical protein
VTELLQMTFDLRPDESTKLVFDVGDPFPVPNKAGETVMARILKIEWVTERQYRLVLDPTDAPVVQ